jgi:hypothetical protein
MLVLVGLDEAIATGECASCAHQQRPNATHLFAATNPDVSCKDSDFALLEMPTRMMPGP